MFQTVLSWCFENLLPKFPIPLLPSSCEYLHFAPIFGPCAKTRSGWWLVPKRSTHFRCAKNKKLILWSFVALKNVPPPCQSIKFLDEFLVERVARRFATGKFSNNFEERCEGVNSTNWFFSRVRTNSQDSWSFLLSKVSGKSFDFWCRQRAPISSRIFGIFGVHLNCVFICCEITSTLGFHFSRWHLFVCTFHLTKRSTKAEWEEGCAPFLSISGMSNVSFKGPALFVFKLTQKPHFSPIFNWKWQEEVPLIKQLN